MDLFYVAVIGFTVLAVLIGWWLVLDIVVEHLVGRKPHHN